MTDPLPDLPIADLRAAEAAATPGPWWGASKNRRKDGIGVVGVGQGDEAAPIAVLADARQTIKDRQANTALIVALRNAAPVLLAAAEAVERVRQLCDEYRANCDPKSTQAQVAEIFRSAIEGNR